MTQEHRRLLALSDAALRLSDPKTQLGQDLRGELSEESGLSYEVVDYALLHCLEAHQGRAALTQLTRVVTPARRAHVLLSANVFIGAFRAISLALAQSNQVEVRASTRSRAFAQALHEESGGAFSLVNELEVEPDDHLWAYGSDLTLKQVRESLPPGSYFYAHGSGMGVVVLTQSTCSKEESLREAARGIALDAALFDQRGCLSPRMILLEGDRDFVTRFANALYLELNQIEERLPRGDLDRQEKIDAAAYCSTMTYLGSCAPAGQGLLFVDPQAERLIIPPIGRYLHLTQTDDAFALLRPLGAQITTVAGYELGHLPGRLREAWKGQRLSGNRLDTGERRFVSVGQMQMPRLDGPVDLRSGVSPERIE